MYGVEKFWAYFKYRKSRSRCVRFACPLAGMPFAATASTRMRQGMAHLGAFYLVWAYTLDGGMYWHRHTAAGRDDFFTYTHSLNTHTY